jgi:magnesium chelatase family protein
VPFQKLAGLESGEPSASIRQRVEAARQIQAERFGAAHKPNLLVNGDIGPAEVQTFFCASLMPVTPVMCTPA